jgi:hypothetical protein
VVEDDVVTRPKAECCKRRVVGGGVRFDEVFAVEFVSSTLLGEVRNESVGDPVCLCRLRIADRRVERRRQRRQVREDERDRQQEDADADREILCRLAAIRQ